MGAVTPRRPEGGAQAELGPGAGGVGRRHPPGSELRAGIDAADERPDRDFGLNMLGLGAGQTLAVSGGAGLLAS